MQIASSSTRTETCGGFKPKSVNTKLHKRQISQFTSQVMFKQFHYLTTNFHESFVSFTYFLGQKVITVVTIAKVIKCLS